MTWGAGPRASQYLILGAKTYAAIHGRFSPDIDDVKAMRPGITTTETDPFKGKTLFAKSEKSRLALAPPRLDFVDKRGWRLQSKPRLAFHAIEQSHQRLALGRGQCVGLFAQARTEVRALSNVLRKVVETNQKIIVHREHFERLAVRNFVVKIHLRPAAFDAGCDGLAHRSALVRR